MRIVSGDMREPALPGGDPPSGIGRPEAETPNRRRSVLGRFRELPGVARRELVHAWWELLRVDLHLRRAAGAVITKALDDSQPVGGAERFEEAVAVARRVGRAAAYTHRPQRGLPRPGTRPGLLRRRGIPASLRIGVRRDAGRIAAHAWIEVAGTPLGEPAAVEERFVALVSSR